MYVVNHLYEAVVELWKKGAKIQKHALEALKNDTRDVGSTADFDDFFYFAVFFDSF